MIGITAKARAQFDLYPAAAEVFDTRLSWRSNVMRGYIPLLKQTVG